MKIIDATSLSSITLGRQGENHARQVVFDVSDWEAEYGPGVVELIAQRPGDEKPYPVAVKRDATQVIWDITSVETAIATHEQPGKCELRYYVGEVLAKSKTWRLWVEAAMGTPSETAPPEPEQGWVDQVLAVGAEVLDATAAATNSADAAEKSATAAKSAQGKAEDAQKGSEAARDRAEMAAVRQPVPNAETGTWWVWDVVAAAYVDSGASIADQPRVVEVSGAELAMTLANNTEVRCADPVTALTIEGFSAGTEGRAEQWGLVFTASADGITVTVPDSLVWAMAEPIFTAGNTYWLSVVPLGDKYLAAWTEVVADEQTTA